MALRVLIADDDNVGIMLLRVMIERCGHTVISESRDGVELLSEFVKLSEDVDAVVTDIMMPNMNGMEAVRHIKKIKSVPCVVVTAVDHGTSIEDSMGKYIPWTTCDFFVSKPISLASISSVLAEIVYSKSKILTKPWSKI